MYELLILKIFSIMYMTVQLSNASINVKNAKLENKSNGVVINFSFQKNILTRHMKIKIFFNNEFKEYKLQLNKKLFEKTLKMKIYCEIKYSIILNGTEKTAGFFLQKDIGKPTLIKIVVYARSQSYLYVKVDYKKRCKDSTFDLKKTYVNLMIKYNTTETISKKIERNFIKIVNPCDCNIRSCKQKSYKVFITRYRNQSSVQSSQKEIKFCKTLNYLIKINKFKMVIDSKKIISIKIEVNYMASFKDIQTFSIVTQSKSGKQLSYSTLDANKTTHTFNYNKTVYCTITALISMPANNRITIENVTKLLEDKDKIPPSFIEVYKLMYFDSLRPYYHIKHDPGCILDCTTNCKSSLEVNLTFDGHTKKTQTFKLSNSKITLIKLNNYINCQSSRTDVYDMILKRKQFPIQFPNQTTESPSKKINLCDSPVITVSTDFHNTMVNSKSPIKVIGQSNNKEVKLNFSFNLLLVNPELDFKHTINNGDSPKRITYLYTSSNISSGFYQALSNFTTNYRESSSLITSFLVLDMIDVHVSLANFNFQINETVECTTKKFDALFNFHWNCSVFNITFPIGYNNTYMKHMSKKQYQVFKHIYLIEENILFIGPKIPEVFFTCTCTISIQAGNRNIQKHNSFMIDLRDYHLVEYLQVPLGQYLPFWIIMMFIWAMSLMIVFFFVNNCAILNEKQKQLKSSLSYIYRSHKKIKKSDVYLKYHFEQIPFKRKHTRGKKSVYLNINLSAYRIHENAKEIIIKKNFPSIHRPKTNSDSDSLSSVVTSKVKIIKIIPKQAQKIFTSNRIFMAGKQTDETEPNKTQLRKKRTHRQNFHSQASDLRADKSEKSVASKKIGSFLGNSRIQPPVKKNPDITKNVLVGKNKINDKIPSMKTEKKLNPINDTRFVKNLNQKRANQGYDFFKGVRKPTTSEVPQFNRLTNTIGPLKNVAEVAKYDRNQTRTTRKLSLVIQKVEQTRAFSTLDKMKINIDRNSMFITSDKGSIYNSGSENWRDVLNKSKSENMKSNAGNLSLYRNNDQIKNFPELNEGDITKMFNIQKSSSDMSSYFHKSAIKSSRLSANRNQRKVKTSRQVSELAKLLFHSKGKMVPRNANEPKNFTLLSGGSSDSK